MTRNTPHTTTEQLSLLGTPPRARFWIDSWTPRQHGTTPGFKKKADYYRQRLLKYPGIGEFHSRYELYYAALLEGDPQVTHYVPQAHKMRFGKSKPYYPDFHVMYTDGRHDIVELKQTINWTDPRWEQLQWHCQHQGHRFVLIENAAIGARAVEAENWLEVVRHLVTGHLLETPQQEAALLMRCCAQGQLCLGEVIDGDDRQRSYLDELALYRLLHRGELRANLTTPLLMETTLWPTL